MLVWKILEKAFALAGKPCNSVFLSPGKLVVVSVGTMLSPNVLFRNRWRKKTMGTG